MLWGVGGGRGQAPQQLQIGSEPTVVIIITLFIRLCIPRASPRFVQLLPRPHEGGAGGRTWAARAQGHFQRASCITGGCPGGPQVIGTGPGSVWRPAPGPGLLPIPGGRWGQPWGPGHLPPTGSQGQEAKCKGPPNGSEGRTSREGPGQMGWSTCPLASHPQRNDADGTRSRRKPPSPSRQAGTVEHSRGHRRPAGGAAETELGTWAPIVAAPPTRRVTVAPPLPSPLRAGLPSVERGTRCLCPHLGY